MLWFLAAILTLYGGLQLFVFLELHRAFPRRWPWRLAPALLLVVMNATLVLSRLLVSSGGGGPAAVAAFVGHWWVTASLWFFLIGALVEAWNLGVRVAGRPPYGGLAISPRRMAAAAGLIILGLSVWGVMEASVIRLETVVIQTPRLPAGSKALRVVQVSDLHLSLLMSRGRMARILARVREARPDLLVFTGDFADEVSPHVCGLVALLAEIEAPLGKLAATGNHEFYLGIGSATLLLSDAGFRLLRGESVKVADHLIVAGADDLAALRLGRHAFAGEGLALPSSDHSEFVILLKHQPLVDERSRGRFDLQLSGHTHGGQVFPGGGLLRLFYRHLAGRYELPGGATLYVSRGAGTFGPPMRVLSPPEVTLILIEPQAPRAAEPK